MTSLISQYIKIWETTLEKLVESNKNEISELRGNIKGYYEKKAEASTIRSKVNWYEKGKIYKVFL